MNKASLFASAAVASLALAGVTPAFAQGGGPFADVPTDHWAYQHVDKLQKRGIVIGYPDGTYGGKRAMTRYEFAIAISRLLDQMGANSGAALPGGGITREELDRILADFARKSDLAGFMTKEEADQLRRLISEFQTELTTLGVDLDRVRQRVDALEGRVRFLEEEAKRVQIGGNVNLMIRGNHRRGNTRGVIDQDGFRVTGGARSRGGILADTRVLHDLDLNIKARLSDTATAHAVLNFGNYLDFLGGVASFNGARSDRNYLTGLPQQRVNQDQSQTIYKLALEAPINIAGLAINLSAGRLPMQFTPYTLKLMDVDNYFYNEKTDLGDVPLDGAKTVFALGPVGVTAFAAKSDPIKHVSNVSGKIVGDNPYALFAGAGRAPFLTNINGAAGTAQGGFRGGVIRTIDDNGSPTMTGNRPVGSVIAQGFDPNVFNTPSVRPSNNAMAVEQLAGARLTLGTSAIGTIGGTFLALSGSSPNTTVLGNENFERVYVYGADINATLFSAVGFMASYTKSDTEGVTSLTNSGLTTKVGTNNFAFDAALNYASGAFTVGAGYKEIAPLFAAPGYWGRIGSWTNPVDIAGGYLKGSYTLGGGYVIDGIAQTYEGSQELFGFQGGLGTNSGIRNFRVGLKLPGSSLGNIDLGVEYTEYEIGSPLRGASGKPYERFINIGYGYAFNPTTSFKLLYQIIDYNDKGSGFDTQNRNGGVGAAQFSVKF